MAVLHSYPEHYQLKGIELFPSLPDAWHCSNGSAAQPWADGTEPGLVVNLQAAVHKVNVRWLRMLHRIATNSPQPITLRFFPNLKLQQVLSRIPFRQRIAGQFALASLASGPCARDSNGAAARSILPRWRRSLSPTCARTSSTCCLRAATCGLRSPAHRTNQNSRVCWRVEISTWTRFLLVVAPPLLTRCSWPSRCAQRRLSLPDKP
eukprot:SAG11_NODE_1635_length_4539_cov_2.188514_7_plen_207_part_00